MKKTFIQFFIILLFFVRFGAWGQDFQTIRSGPWNNAETWEGGIVPPSGSHNRTIQINSGHTVNFSGNFSYGNNTTLIVKGTLNINSWHFSLGNNSTLRVEGLFRNSQFFRMGNDARIEVSGQLINQGYNFQTGNNTELIVTGSLSNSQSMTFGNNTTVHVSGQINNSGYTFLFGNNLFFNILEGGQLTNSTRFVSGTDGQFAIKGHFTHTGYQFSVGSNTEIWVEGNLTSNNNWSFQPEPNTQIFNCNDLNLNNFNHPNVQIQNCVLPIKLLAFEAVFDNGRVILHWTTGSEMNNDYFTIERSHDACNVSEIGFVTGAGNSNRTLHYQFVDHDPLPGVSYYRLKQTDFDGSYEYSDWLAVEAKDIGERLMALAIKQPQGILLRIYSPKERTLQVQLADIQGRIIYNQRLNPGSPGQIDALIPMPKSANRVLLYRITDGLDTFTGKFIWWKMLSKMVVFSHWLKIYLKNLTTLRTNA